MDSESLLPQKHDPPLESLPTTLITIIKNAFPVILEVGALFITKNFGFHFLKETGNPYYVGSAGLAITWINIFAIAIAMCLNVGLIAKASQAFGAKDRHQVGIYFHKAVIINAILIVPISILLYFSDRMFLLLGADSHTAIYAQQMCTLCIIGVYGFVGFNTMASYLNACDLFKVPSLVQVICSGIYVTVAYVTIEVLDMGVVGTAISFNVQFCLAFLLLFLYVKIKNPIPGTFFWFKKESFKGLWDFFKYECVAGAMNFFEWVSWEILYTFSSALSTTQLTAFTIILNSFQVAYVIHFGVYQTLLIFIGNAMGEQNPKKAQQYLKGGLIMTVCNLAIIETVYGLFPYQIAEFYSFEPDVINLTVKTLRLYLIFFVLDFFQMILMGVLRSIGKEKAGSGLMLFALAVGLSAGWLLCFKADLQLQGLALGHIIADSILFIGPLFIHAKIDWKVQSDIIAEKLKMDKEKFEGKEHKAENAVAPECK